MPSCSVRPVEVIAADLHKVNYECCLTTEQSSAPARALCPVSGTLSRKVLHRTVENLVKLEKRSAVRDIQYYFCPDPHCSVVYFSSDSVQITKDDMSVKVFNKDSGEDVPGCYCFLWTRKRIRDEIESTGTSTAALSIAEEIHAGRCACDVKNPKGECCLGDVHLVVKEFLRPVRK